MKWYSIVLLFSLVIAVIAVDIEDIEEELEDARVSIDDNDDDEVITIGELRELEQRLQRDSVPKPIALGRLGKESRFNRRAKRPNPNSDIRILIIGKK